MATVHFDHFFTTHRELGTNIASYLDLCGLNSLARVCKTSINIALDEKVCKVVAGKFALKLKKEIDDLSQVEPIPNDIRLIIGQDGPLSFNTMKILQEYRNVRDVLVVWEEIAKKINQDPSNLSLDVFKTSEEMIKKADEFSTWCKDYQSQLDAVSELKLTGKKLQKLPSQIENLFQLTSLNLSENHFEKLPREIGNFSRLTSLHLYNNYLRKLPPQIENLSQLISLSLTNNLLDELPPEIGKLSKLVHLHLSNNRLKNLPSEIGHLSQLIELHLSHNTLEKLPAEIGNFNRLILLMLNNNQLKELPSEIGKLSRLTAFALNDNRLKKLPPEIGKLSRLVAFSLENNKLKELPSQIGDLSALININLNNNHLKELPPEFWKLKLVVTSYANNQFSKTTELKYRFWQNRMKIQRVALAALILGGCIFIYYSDNAVSHAIRNVVQQAVGVTFTIVVLYIINYVKDKIENRL